jgi:hypothetical protein
VYPHDNTTKTWACINAIANSNELNAIINNSGRRPTKKNTRLEVIILYVNPLNIFSNICPESTLAASLKPSETFLAKLDINSINTSKGSKASGHPAGTNKEKYFKLCSFSPNIVEPITIVKLKLNVKIK